MLVQGIGEAAGSPAQGDSGGGGGEVVGPICQDVNKENTQTHHLRLRGLYTRLNPESRPGERGLGVGVCNVSPSEQKPETAPGSETALNTEHMMRGAPNTEMCPQVANSLWEEDVPMEGESHRAASLESDRTGLKSWISQ